MRNALAALKRNRQASSLLINTGRHDGVVFPAPTDRASLHPWEVGAWLSNRSRPCFLLRNSFSTAFTSVHGERPSAEYAKLRKESLESEFGQALGSYSSGRVSIFYRFGPFLALYRAAIVSFHFFRLAFWQLFVRDIKKRAVKFRETLIRLGTFYIKLGQALSTRPDILPSVYCLELAKLQDQIPPFATKVALKSIESQLGAPISQIFADITPEPIAAASLGQVYKAHLHSGELVAVKVQRPGMSRSLTLDALLFHMIGGQLKRFAKARKDLLVAVNEMVRHMFDEIDYILEGKNAEHFASLYGYVPCHGVKNHEDIIATSAQQNKMQIHIKVPKIYWNLTRKAVLTMEWINGIKLTDEAGIQKAGLNRRVLIDQVGACFVLLYFMALVLFDLAKNANRMQKHLIQFQLTNNIVLPVLTWKGLYCSLRQLLEVGFFHADPHPGNLVATDTGTLAYFDFGMMGDVPRHYRVGLIQVLVHFVNRDSLGLANDFLSLGFLPEGVDIKVVSDALQASFGDGTRQSRDFEAIMNQLYDVMYKFEFSLPPDYALVIRALGSLEGTAKILDPNFKVVESAYPFVIGRLLADPNPDMRRILRQLLICNDGSIRWNRLERLMAAISEQATESASDSEELSKNPLGWKSFDMRAVVGATEDLLQFILSEKGLRVRVFLLRDIIKAADTFFLDEVVSSFLSEKHVARGTSNSEGYAMLMRVANGFQSLRQAVKLAPEVWTAMLIRMVLKPEVHQYCMDIVSALFRHFSHRVPESFWILLSRILHKLVTNCNSGSR